MHPVMESGKSRAACWLVASLLVNAAAWAGDIYTSVDANGQERWSSQALDVSYVAVPALRIPDVVPAAVLRRTTPADKAVQVRMEARRRSLSPLVQRTAQRHGVSAALVMAVIEVESGYNPQALSPRGARGLMQLLPATASRYDMRDARELYDPARNVDMGTRHLKDLLAQHGGQWALAMAAYNAGAQAVVRHGQRIPAYRETMLYVPAVLAAAARFSNDLDPSSRVENFRE